MIAAERQPLFIEYFVSMVSTIWERHSTVVVLCLSILSKEQEAKKCMRWSFGLPTDITPGCAVRSVKQRPHLSVYAVVSRI